MKLTDYEIIDALGNGKKIRRMLWLDSGFYWYDAYIKMDADGNWLIENNKDLRLREEDLLENDWMVY